MTLLEQEIAKKDEELRQKDEQIRLLKIAARQLSVGDVESNLTANLWAESSGLAGNAKSGNCYPKL